MRATRENDWIQGELPDLILGGQDGLVNVLGLVLGLAAATDNGRIVIIGALAALLAESISMGAVAYTSRVAERDYYQAQRDRQRREIDEHPDAKRAELRKAVAKLVGDDIADQAVESITKDKDRWAEALMQIALDVSEPQRTGIARGIIVGAATAVGSFIPLMPFLLLPPMAAAIAAVVISGLALFGVGAYKARTLVGDWRRSGLQLTVIGLGASFAGYLIGVVLRP
jgi:VIT1/CCC1 family predicted Fe2+/Mn2+ transporter